MDAKNAIDQILRDACGNRASGREMLVRPKRTYLDAETAAVLKEQWTSAGRDNAYVVMMLSEEDGSNPHLVTGWNGKDTYCCLTERGLTYVDHRHLEKMKQHEGWNPKTRLIDIRAHQLTETDEMHRSDVDVLMDRIKRTLTKSGKKRRKGRLRNMEKFFAAAVDESNKFEAKSSDTPFSGPLKGDSETEFEKIKEKDDRIPEGLKEPSTQKLPKDAKAEQSHRESYDWRKRCAPTHPMMQENATDSQLDKREHVRQDSEGKGSSGSATPGGNKCDPQEKLRQLVRMNRESKKYLEQGDAQLDRRELVTVNKESGGGVGPIPGGNKSDPQQKLRQLVRMDRESGGGTVRSESSLMRRRLVSRNVLAQAQIREEKAMGAKDSSDKSDDPDCTTYAGEKADKKEFASRPKIAVRHEGISIVPDGESRFSPDNCPQRSPEGAKKPLVMLMMMGKGGKKQPMAESKKTPSAFLANIEKMKSKAAGRKDKSKFGAADLDA